MKYRFVFLLLLMLSASLLSAQEKKISVRDYLTVLEKKYSVKFSYNDYLLDGKYVDSLLHKKSLAGNLKKICDYFSFDTIKINDRYYILAEKKITLKVYVYDKDDQKPIEGVKVTLLGKARSVLTRRKGKFRLKNISKFDTIRFSSLGYKDSNVTVKNLLKVKKIYLEKATNILKEVKVNAKKKNIYIHKNKGAAIRLKVTRNEDMYDIFGNIQSFSGISNPYDNNGEVFIRGGKPYQNLVLFNGIRVYKTSVFFGAVSALNPFMCNNVNILKSSTGAKYGNNISGVLNITTKNTIPENINGIISADFLNYNTLLNLPVSRKIGVTVSLRKSYGFQTLFFKKTVDKTFQNSFVNFFEDIKNLDGNYDNLDLSFFDYATKTTYKLAKKSYITFKSFNFKNRFNYEAKIVQPDSVKQNFNVKLNNENYGVGISWRQTINDRNYVKSDFYSSSHRRSDKYFHKNDYFTFDISGEYFIEDIGVKTLFKSVNNDKTSSLITGYEFLLQKLNNELSSDLMIDSITRSYTHTIFLNRKISLNKNMIGNIGVRANYNSLFRKLDIFPRLFFKKQLFPKVSINTGFEIKQQNLNYPIDLINEYPFLNYNTWVLNKQVARMKNIQYNFGVTFEDKKTSLNVEFYHKNISGALINSQGLTPEERKELFFEGKSIVKGLDVSLIKNITTNYSTNLNYSFGEASYEFDELNNGNPFPSDIDVTNNLSWVHSFTFNKLNFSLSWLFRTGLPYSKIKYKKTLEPRADSNWNSERLPNYHRLDLSGNYSFFYDKNIRFSIGMSLRNLLDNVILIKRSNTHVFNSNNELEQKYLDYFSQSFTPNVSLKLELL